MQKKNAPVKKEGGDFISKEYSGTESVLTKITLKGHQNAFDKVE